MSSNSTSSGDSELVSSTLSAYLTTNYAILPAAVILLYDYAITISDEVGLIWCSKKTAVTIIYAFNRASSMIYALSVLLLMPLWTALPSAIVSDVLYVVPQFVLFIVWAVFSALRVYAVGQRAWHAASVVFAITLLPFALNLYIEIHTKFISLGGVWIGYYEVSTDEINLIGMLVRGSAIISDAAVVLCTWVSVYMLGGRDGIRRDGRSPLVNVLLQDGTVYFGALLVLNIVLLVVYSRSQSVETNLGPIVSAISSVIVSRFILDLRRVDKEREQSQSLPSDSVLSFRRQRSTTVHSGFLGNMGAALNGSFGFSARSESEPGSTCTEGDDGGLELGAVSGSASEGIDGETAIEGPHVQSSHELCSVSYLSTKV